MILVVAGVIVFSPGLTWYVRIDHENRIEINDLTTLKTVTYNLSDISAITYSEKYHTKKGVEKGIAHYRIVMNDGYTYSSHVFGFFSLQEDDNRLKEKMEELSTRTGVAIRRIP